MRSTHTASLETFKGWFRGAQAQLIQNLLLPSRVGFEELTSLKPPVTDHGQSYIDQYRNIREDILEIPASP